MLDGTESSCCNLLKGVYFKKNMPLPDSSIEAGRGRMRTGMTPLPMLGRGSAAVCHVRQSEHRHITSFACH